MSHITTRRAVLAGAASIIPAVALAPAALAVAAPDPIYAAIEQWRECCQAVEDAISAVGRLEQAQPDFVAWPAMGRVDWVTYKGRRASVCRSSHEEIDAYFADWLAEAEAESDLRRVALLKKRRARSHADLEANERTRKAKRDACGLTAATDYQDACEATMEAADTRLGETQPTTLAGAAALVAFLQERICDHQSWSFEQRDADALWSLQVALHAMAGLPHPDDSAKAESESEAA